MTEVWSDLPALRPGVVVFGPEVNEPGRIEASSGTRAASPSDGEYEDGAIIPAGEWQDLPRNDRKMFLGTKAARERNATIRIVGTSSVIVDRFRELRELAQRCQLDEIRRQLSRPEFRDAIEMCKRYVSERFANGLFNNPGFISGGIRANATNLCTVTVHPQTGKYVGLHVDNWTRLPLNQRHLAPKRICINLGNDPRYFLFVNLSIRRLLDAALGTPVEEFKPSSWGPAISHDMLRVLDRTAGGTAVARAFMACSPRYPVIRLKVYPGEAYIAPTENIIHDGSSAGAKGMDVSLSLRAEGT